MREYEIMNLHTCKMSKPSGIVITYGTRFRNISFCRWQSDYFLPLSCVWESMNVKRNSMYETHGYHLEAQVKECATALGSIKLTHSPDCIPEPPVCVPLSAWNNSNISSCWIYSARISYNHYSSTNLETL